MDLFRLVAALLVAAVHTAPLQSYSPLADFILTRIAARVAVPFFLLATGFFLLSRLRPGTARLGALLKKTAALYAAAMVFYLPLNLYNGAFAQNSLLPTLLRAVLVDGTVYHLWYLPARAQSLL